MSIQENGSGKFLQGVKVGEKVAQVRFFGFFDERAQMLSKARIINKGHKHLCF